MTEPKTPSQSTPPLPELYRTLLAQMEQPRKVSASYSIYKNPGGPHTPSSILESLEIGETLLSSTAKETLEALEVASAEPDSDWLDFKWKLMAFIYVQDIFDSPLYAGDDIRTIFHQYYFYYESLNILKESVLCGLNGFYTAAYALLRLFLEFSLLQNYYYRIANATRSYHELERYFHTGIHPAWHTVLKKAFPNDEFSGTVRFRIHSHLRGLSESSIHPYHPDHSPAQHKDPARPHSFEGLHFWVVTRLAVESALWSYHVNFPLLFHPVSILQKFGHKLPVGLFIDEEGGTCVRKSFRNDEDYKSFRDYSTSQQNTSELLKWHKQFPDLSDEEVRATWNKEEDGEYPGLQNGYCLQMAKLRALKRSMALRRPSGKNDRVPEELVAAVQSLKGWGLLRKKKLVVKK